MIDIKNRRLRITPLARRVAAVHHLDLGAAFGAGQTGRVKRADVLALLENESCAELGKADHTQSVAPLRGPWPTEHALALPIASAMVELEVGGALELLEAERPVFARLDLGLSLSVCVAQAAVALLPSYPLLNAYWCDDGIVMRRRLHLALAQLDTLAANSTNRNLRWALVPDAGDLTRRGLARALAAPDAVELRATFAVVALGSQVSWQSAVLPLPHTAAALILGAPTRRLVARGAQIAMGWMAPLTLSYDARVLNHSEAAAFLVALRAIVEQLGARSR